METQSTARHLPVQIQQKSIDRDPVFGQENSSWGAYWSTRGNLVFENGSEDVDEEMTYNIQRAKLILNYRVDKKVTGSMRVLVDDKYWSITGVQSLGRKRHLELKLKFYESIENANNRHW